MNEISQWEKPESLNPYSNVLSSNFWRETLQIKLLRFLGDDESGKILESF